MNLKLKNWINLKSWRPYFIIFVLGFLLYSQTLFFKYTYFDDSTLILNKAQILENIDNVGRIFSTDAFFSGDKFYYRPILNLSFMFDAQLGGTLPFFYHLDNVLLHLIATMLVFYFLFEILKKKKLAFFLAIIFLVHPVLTQAVAWLPGRNDSLLAIFVLASFIFFLNFLKQPRLKTYLVYLFFLFCALLTKENAVFLPVLVVFYFLFINCGRSLKTDRWLLVAGSFAVEFVWFVMRRLALGGSPINYFSAIIGIIKNSSALLLDIGKIILPIKLGVLPILVDSTLVYGIGVLVLLIVVYFLSRSKRHNYLIFGGLWFLLFLLPSFIRLNGQPDFLEHRLYLPLIGFLIILAEFDFIKKLDFNRRRVQVSVGLIIILLASLTFYHSRNFSDRLTFWKTAAQESPHSPLAQKNLGVMYYFIGNYVQAEKYDNIALKLNPQETMVYNNLGVIAMNQGKYQQARQDFNQELKINPGYANALNNLNLLSYYQHHSKQRKVTK